MPTRTPAQPDLTISDVIVQLKLLHGVQLDEDLRRKVPNSWRTIQRWKADGWPQSARAALILLKDADLLREPAEEADEEEGQRLLLEGLARSVEVLVGSHREALEDLEAVSERLARLEAARPGARRGQASRSTGSS